MKEIIIFVITYLIVYLVYYLFIIRKAKRRNSKKRPMEINYLISKYKIDIKKVDYNKLLRNTNLISSLDITILVTVASFIRNYYILIGMILLLVIPIIMISYGILGKYYVKKGMTIDE